MTTLPIELTIAPSITKVRLRRAIGVIPDLTELALPAAARGKALRAISTQSGSYMGVYVGTTTNYARAVRWDGTLTAPFFGDFEPVFVDFGTVTAPWNSSIPKPFAVFSCDSSGDPLGEITYFEAGLLLTVLDVAGLAQLNSISVVDNTLRLIDMRGCPALKYVTLFINKFDSSTMDEILKQIDANGTLNGSLALQDNAPRTSASDESVARLIAKGWSVSFTP